MIRTALVPILLLLAGFVSAQPADTLWTLTVNMPNPGNQRAITSLAATDDGSVFAMASTVAGSYNPNILLKISPDGNLLWDQFLNGDPLYVENGEIISDGGEGIYLCGTGPEGILVAHLDGQGGLLWVSQVPDDGELTRTFAMTRLPDGDVAVSGEFISTGPGPSGLFIARFALGGAFLWRDVNDFDADDVFSTDIHALPDGTLVASGGTYNWDTDYHRVLGATHPDGYNLWTLQRDGSRFYDVEQDPAGNLVALESDSLLTITPGGVLLDSRRLDPSAGRELDSMPAGGYMLSGDDYTLYRTDDTFDLLGSLAVYQPDGEGRFYAGQVVPASGFLAGGKRSDGSLCVVRLEDEGQEPVTLDLFITGGTPIPPGGGTLSFNAIVTLNLPSPASGQAWTGLTLPNGQVFEPLLLLPVTFTPGETVYTGAQQFIPALAPPGAYTLTGNLGLYPGWVAATDEIWFMKQSGGMAEEFFGEMSTASIPSTGGFLGAPGDCDLTATSDDPTSANLPVTSTLSNPYPNPFNAATTLTLHLPEAGVVRATLHDITGRRIREILHQPMNAGEHAIAVDGSGLATGSYLLRVEVPGQLSATRKLTLMK